MSLQLKIITEVDSVEWDNIVATNAHGTIFHRWKWLKIVEKNTNSIFYPIMVYKGTTLVGIYPIFIQEKGFIKLAFSPPSGAYLIYLGPVINNYENLKQDKKESIFMHLQEEMDKFIFSDLNCKYSRIRSPPGLYDSRPLRWSGYKVEPLYTYRIDLTGGEKKVWEQFDRQLRVTINKAIREGVTVEEGNKNDIDFIHESLLRRFNEQGSRSKDHLKYLSDLYDEFHPNNMKIFIAKYNGEKIGGMFSLFYKDIMYLWVGVSKSDLKGISPNDLTQWEAIKWACNNGYKYYEEMDAGDDPRLRYFKSKYNPELVIWYSAVKHSSFVYKIAEKTIKFINTNL